MNDTHARPAGPIEDKPLPARLQAHVVEAGSRPRIHGFDVQEDLARYYGSAHVTLLALAGELPAEEVRAAFEIAAAFIAASVSIAEASTHAAVVGRVCGPRVASMVSVAAIGLAEQARTILDRHDTILPKLAIGSLNGSAAKFAPADDEERAAVQRLRTALGAFTARVPAIGYDIGLDTAIIATLMSCGLRSREHIEVIFTSLRLPVVCAEALAWKPGDLRGYPMDLPRFVYTGSAQ